MKSQWYHHWKKMPERNSHVSRKASRNIRTSKLRMSPKHIVPCLFQQNYSIARAGSWGDENPFRHVIWQCGTSLVGRARWGASLFRESSQSRPWKPCHATLRSNCVEHLVRLREGTFNQYFPGCSCITAALVYWTAEGSPFSTLRWIQKAKFWTFNPGSRSPRGSAGWWA